MHVLIDTKRVVGEHRVVGVVCTLTSYANEPMSYLLITAAFELRMRG